VVMGVKLLFMTDVGSSQFAFAMPEDELWEADGVRREAEPIVSRETMRRLKIGIEELVAIFAETDGLVFNANFWADFLYKSNSIF